MRYTYSLGGSDRSSFTIDTGSGQIRVAAGVDLNFELKLLYSINVSVTDGKDSEGNADSTVDDTVAVTIDVNNVDEPGRLTFTRLNPTAGTSLTAMLVDPDQAVESVTWQWQRSSLTMVDVWEDIAGAESATYTPGIPDIGRFLRVIVSYSDFEGPGKSVTASVASATVAATGSPMFAQRTVSRHVDENSAGGVTVGNQVGTLDPDGDTLTYSLGGDDASSFTIDTDSGQIRVAAAADLDFETKPLYLVTVSVTDGKDSGGNADPAVDDTVVVFIDINNIDEPGNLTVTAGTPTAGTALTATLSDPDGGITGVIWQWERTDLTDTTVWEDIDEAESSSYTPTASDIGRFLRVGVFYKDAQSAIINKTATSAATAAVAAATRAPMFADRTVSRSIDENSAGGVAVGEPVKATDADGDTLTYSLGGINRSSFTIDAGSGQISVAAGTLLNYEFRQAYAVTVSVTDGKDSEGNVDSAVDDTAAVTINVNNVDEAGSVTVTAGTPAAGTALTATLSDPDGGVTSVTWQWQRTSLTMFDVWEDISDAESASYTPTAHEIGRFLRAVASYTDSEGSGKTAISGATVAVAAATGAPTFADRVVSRSVDENSAGGVAVGEPVEANDADGDTLTYSLDGADASSFTIDTDSGQIRVAADAMLDFERKPLYSVTVSVTDNKDSEGNADPTVDGIVVVTINVNNVDDDGSVTVTAGTPTAGTALTATLSDPDGGVMSVTWQWQRTSLIMAEIWEDITGAESDSYTPTANDIGRFLRAVASYTDALGSGKTATSGATAAVAAATGAPTFADRVVSRSVDENSAGGVAVGEPVEANDADGDTLTYPLDGDDASSFTIDTGSGQIRVAAGADLDYERKPLYSVTVGVTDNKDSEGNADPTLDDIVVVTINVDNVDEAGSVTVTPPPAAGSALTATLSDPDGGVMSLTWQWQRTSLTNTGVWEDITDAEAASYTPTAHDIGRFLRAVASYTDSEGSGKTAISGATAVVATATGAPTFADRTVSRSVDENSAAEVAVGDPVAARHDAGDVPIYSLSGADAASFTIDTGSGQIRVAAAADLDYETKPLYSVTVSVTDNKDSEDNADSTVDDMVMVTITVTNLNEPGSVTVMPAPVASIASTADVTDPDGTVPNVTSWAWEVAETQDSAIWTTAAGTGAATDTYTPVVAETGKWLRVTAVYPDPVFTTATTVRAVVGPVRAANPQAGFPDDDNGGLGDGTADPVSFSVEENAAATTVVGTVAATDTDGDTLTYTVTGTDATAFAETFALNANSGEITVKAGGTVDFETKPSYVITVNVSDGQDADGQADNAIDDMVMVTITVTNLNEPGSVTVMPAPVAGIASTADVTDPDGTVANVTSWAWEVAETQDSAIWTTAAKTGAATDTYTPVVAETGKWLRVTAVYPDPVFTTAATVRAVVGPVRAANPQAGFPDDDNGGLGDGTADPVSFSVEENAAATTVVGTVMATDTDGDTLTYTVTGTDATAFAETFALNANSGEITVKAGGTVDFETKPSYVITVNVSDGQDADGRADNAIDDMVMVTITVTNLNEPGSVTVMPAPVAGIASTADVTDPDGTVANVTSWAWEVAETQDAVIWTTAAGTGAATDTYTPVTAETGKWLRVTAVYPDPVFTTAATVRAVVGPVGATVTVSFGSSTYTVVEGASVTVTVDLDVDPERTVTIPLTATNENGTTSSDYRGVPSSVVFNSGETAKTFNFMATQDRQDDDGERVRLAFGTFPAGVSADSPDETVVSITDDDVPEVIVSPDTVPVPEGGSSRYSVVLSTEPAGTVTVTVIDPTDNTDVTADPSTLTFTSSNWESAQYVTVSAISDDDFMDDTATVTHAVSGYGSVIDALSVTVTVNDDESAVALVTNLGESLDGTYTFGANHRVSMIFRTGLHSLGYIFTGLVFDVQTAAPDEMTFTVILAEYDRIANAQSNPVTLTGEFTATGEVYFTPESPVALSRNQWYLVFLQSSYDGPLTGNALGQLSATSSDMETTQPGDTNWVIGNTRSDTDLDNLGSVQINTQTLRFAVQGRKVDLNPPMGAPTISGNLVVGEPLTADTSAITDTDGLTMVTYAYEWFRVDGEKNETVIEGATQSTYLLTNEDIGSTMKVRVTFRDDATNPHQLESEETGVVTPLAVAVSFGASTYTVVEGGTVTVAVTLDVDPERTVVVPITVTDQGGASSADYSRLPPNVTFSSGETSQTFTFTAADDSSVDGGESIKLGFGTLPAKVTEGSTDETTVSITDNDVAGVTVNPTTVTVAEGETATYQVKLNTLPTGTVTVTINDPTDNTVVTADTPSLSFDSTNWNSFQDVTVRAAEDGDAEDDTATVTHTVSGYGTVTTADSVTVSVTDNEPAVEVSFGQTTYTVAEGGTVTVAVTLDVDPERTVVVPITVTDQGGASSADYSRLPPNVTFSSGETSQTFTFTAADDSSVDGGESIKLGFGTLPAKVTEGSTDETTVSITDNDVAGVTVNPTTVTVAEGETATYQVKLNTLPTGTVTVTINDPTDNTVVTADTPSLSFDSTNWNSFQDVTVRAAEDGDAEDDTATVAHTVSGYGTVTTADSVTVSVTDNEPAVEVSFGQTTYTVAEGGTVTVAVTLDVDPERTVVVPITVTDQGGASSADYSRLPPNVTFSSRRRIGGPPAGRGGQRGGVLHQRKCDQRHRACGAAAIPGPGRSRRTGCVAPRQHVSGGVLDRACVRRRLYHHRVQGAVEGSRGQLGHVRGRVGGGGDRDQPHHHRADRRHGVLGARPGHQRCRRRSSVW